MVIGFVETWIAEGNDRVSLSLTAVMPEGCLGIIPDTVIP